jgi:hypothetical protein
MGMPARLAGAGSDQNRIVARWGAFQGKGATRPVGTAATRASCGGHG